MKKIFFATLLLCGIIALSSCKKEYLETSPSNGVSYETVLSKLNLMMSTLSGTEKSLYTFANDGGTGHDNFGQKMVDLDVDLMGNDMIVHTQGYGWFNRSYQYTEWVNATNLRHSYHAWFNYYNIVTQCNTMLPAVEGLQGATQEQKNAVKGQLLGMRAYSYFYLINLFQQTYKGNENAKGVPLNLVLGDNKGRTPVSDVYAQIIADLDEAETLLTGKPRASKVNMDVSVVRGLRARTALQMEDWAKAATAANAARQGYTLLSTSNYTQVSSFSSIDTPEWMWGSYIPEDQSTIYASFFSHMDVAADGYATLGTQKKITKALYDQIPESDVRKSQWTAPGTGGGTDPDYNQHKFQIPNPGAWAADYVYMRAAEMYLIEAEALARQGNDAQAKTVLESLIQTRNPSYSAASLSGSALLNEIWLQRRIELWGEGFGLLDIKRLGQGLNRPTGPGNHGAPNFNPAVTETEPKDARFLMRIPQAELDVNQQMTSADQNP